MAVSKSLLIRADADASIGWGHVMRCLALAQAWNKAGGVATFATHGVDGAILDRLSAERIGMLEITPNAGSKDDASETLGHAVRMRADWIVVDGYMFGREYRTLLRDSGARLCYIDDLGGDCESADVVLNQNLHAAESLYQDRQPRTVLLLGSRYVLLRREFREWLDWRRDIAPVGRKLLITMGGSDQSAATLRVLESLLLVRSPECEVTVLLGTGGSQRQALETARSKLGWQVEINTASPNMAELMAGTDLAVSGAGSTSWELAFMQVPAVLVPLAANQEPIAHELAKAGVSINLGRNEEVSPADIARVIETLAFSVEDRSRMAVRGRAIVDGRGAERVVARLLLPPIELRRASMEDSELLWKWRNDPVVRKQSFSSDAISWQDHLKWLIGKLADSNCWILVGVNEDRKPVGQVRLDLNGARDATVHITVEPAMRDRGYGPAMLVSALDELSRGAAVDIVHAFIRPDNRASLKAFERAGFVWRERAQVGGLVAEHYTCAVTGMPA